MTNGNQKTNNLKNPEVSSKESGKIEYYIDQTTEEVIEDLAAAEAFVNKEEEQLNSSPILLI